MKKTIGNVFGFIVVAGIFLYLMTHLTTTQQILVVLHFALMGVLIYTVAAGIGEVNKRLDRLAMQPPEVHGDHAEGKVSQPAAARGENDGASVP